MGAAWQVWIKTLQHCVNQMERHSKPLAARYGRGTACYVWIRLKCTSILFYQDLTNILELQYAPEGQVWYSAFSPWTHDVSITQIWIYEYPYARYSTISSPRIILKLPTEYGKVLIHMYPSVCWRLSADLFVRWVVAESLWCITENRHSESGGDSIMIQNLIEWDKRFDSIKYLRI
jgi:hypothetical protein